VQEHRAFAPGTAGYLTFLTMTLAGYELYTSEAFTILSIFNAMQVGGQCGGRQRQFCSFLGQHAWKKTLQYKDSKLTLLKQCFHPQGVYVCTVLLYVLYI
jgi:hypothetical protein